MSSEPAVVIEHVSKIFPVYEKPHHRLMQMLWPKNRKHRWHKPFQALDDVSFNILKGETLGIVGRNGSGKSTLLQIICGILGETTGTVRTTGKIAALLELGAGFNPEFSGRENIYLNGALLGLEREEIDKKFSDIVEFSEIGEFIDNPVKSYSSGMFVRLAFSVAIHVTPDILIVDEALSVGDEAFQRKCFSRIQAMRDAGATILFVSHSAGTVLELCDRVILLDRGQVLAEGPPKFVVSRYHKLAFAPLDKRDEVRRQIVREWMDASEGSRHIAGEKHNAAGAQPGSNDEVADFDANMLPTSTVRYHNIGATISKPRVETPEGRQVNLLVANKTYVYRFRVDFEGSFSSVRFGMMLKTTSGMELGGATSSKEGQSGLIVGLGDSVEASFTFVCSLTGGVYFMNAGVLAVVDGQELFLDRIIDAVMFRVLPATDSTVTGIIDFGVVSGVSINKDDSGEHGK